MFDGNGAVYYYATDYPGQVAGLFNASGSVANRYRYSSWGLPETTSEGISNSLRYMSRELDAQTGVYYVRNRWYDATVARFLSEDPIGLEGGINVYAYVGNSPTNTRDPFGLWPVATRYNPWEWDFENPRNPRPSNRGPGLDDDIHFDEGGGASGDTTERETNDRCTAARISFALTAGSDLLSLTGLGAAALYAIRGTRLLRAGRAAGSAVDPISGTIRWQHAANLVDQGESALAYARARAAGTITAGSEMFGATVSVGTTIATAQGFSIWGMLKDITPVWGSVRAYKFMARMCADG